MKQSVGKCKHINFQNLCVTLSRYKSLVQVLVVNLKFYESYQHVK